MSTPEFKFPWGIWLAGVWLAALIFLKRRYSPCMRQHLQTLTMENAGDVAPYPER